MAQYGKTQYWDDRYTRDPEPFDWYQRWEGLKDSVKGHLQSQHSILVLGCGNSSLSEELYEEGYRNITNIDISMVVIKAMKEKYADKTMAFTQMDARTMEFQNAAYNIVLDKGTLDSILCGEGSTQNAQKVLDEIARVLHPNGTYICISHGEPAYRLTYLNRPQFGWNVSVQTVAKPLMGMVANDEQQNVHYIYICKKGDQTEGRAEAETETKALGDSNQAEGESLSQ